MNAKKWTDNLKVGDRVYLDRSYNGKAICKVTRLTDKQIIINYREHEWRFWKKDGFEVGSNSAWSGRDMIRELTPELENSLRIEIKRKKVNELCGSLRTPDTETELDELIAVLSKFAKQETK